MIQNYLPFMNKNIRCFETSYDFRKNNKGKTIYSLDNRRPQAILIESKATEPQEIFWL